MLPLTGNMDLWRQLEVNNRRVATLYREGIQCLVQPISSFDQAPPYAQNSTHVVFIPSWWTDVRRNDELRYGRRTNNAGQIVPRQLVVTGFRDFTDGLMHNEIFCQERLDG